MLVSASDKEKDRIRRIARLLYEASRSIRILRSVDWPPEVKEAFFAKDAKELPKVAIGPSTPCPPSRPCARRAAPSWP